MAGQWAGEGGLAVSNPIAPVPAALLALQQAAWQRAISHPDHPYHWAYHYDDETGEHTECDCGGDQ